MSDQRRIAIVTGAARGIGAAIARGLATGGTVPVLVDIAPEEAAAALVDDIAAAGVEAVYKRADITDSRAVFDTVAAVVAELGDVDVLVNNAGVLSTTPIEELTESEWRRVMDVNVTGALFCTQAVLPHMRARRFGRIVNVSSLAGRMGGITVGAAYAVSKAALIGLTWNLARVVAKEGITVNAVAPGPIDGAMYEGFTPEQRATLEQSIPVGRIGTPEDVARVVTFLASGESSYITGAVIDANGGVF